MSVQTKSRQLAPMYNVGAHTCIMYNMIFHFHLFVSGQGDSLHKMPAPRSIAFCEKNYNLSGSNRILLQFELQQKTEMCLQALQSEAIYLYVMFPRGS